MKISKTCFFFVLMSFFISGTAIGFDPATDCLKTLVKNVDGPVKNILADYTNPKYSKEVNGTYTLCFDPSTKYQDVSSPPLSVQSDVPLIIYGLNLGTSALQDNNTALLQLFGSYIMLENVVFTGNGSGTGVLVTGSNHTIRSSVIQKFNTAIQVGDKIGALSADDLAVGPQVKLGDVGNVITIGINVQLASNLHIADIVYTLSDGGKKIDPSYIVPSNNFGRKCGTTVKKVVEIDGVNKEIEVCDTAVNENIVKKIVGKPPASISSCGSPDTEYGINLLHYDDVSKSFNTLMYCKTEPLDEEINLVKYKSDTDFEITKLAVGECAFKCIVPVDLGITIMNYVGVDFVNKTTSTLLGPALFQSLADDVLVEKHYTLLIDNFDVPSVMGPISNQDVGSEMGTDGDVVIPVDPIDPIDSIKPVDPIDPVDPVKPIVLTDDKLDEQDNGEKPESEYVNIDPSDPPDKNKQMSSKTSADGISQGAGCSGKASLLPDSHFSLIQMLIYMITMLAIPPLVAIRIRKK